MPSVGSCHSCKGVLGYVLRLSGMPRQHPKLARHWKLNSLTNLVGQLFVIANTVFCVFWLPSLLSDDVCVTTITSHFSKAITQYKHNCTVTRPTPMPPYTDKPTIPWRQLYLHVQYHPIITLPTFTNKCGEMFLAGPSERPLSSLCNSPGIRINID